MNTLDMLLARQVPARSAGQRSEPQGQPGRMPTEGPATFTAAISGQAQQFRLNQSLKQKDAEEDIAKQDGANSESMTAGDEAALLDEDNSLFALVAAALTRQGPGPQAIAGQADNLGEVEKVEEAAGEIPLDDLQAPPPGDLASPKRLNMANSDEESLSGKEAVLPPSGQKLERQVQAAGPQAALQAARKSPDHGARDRPEILGGGTLAGGALPGRILTGKATGNEAGRPTEGRLLATDQVEQLARPMAGLSGGNDATEGGFSQAGDRRKGAAARFLRDGPAPQVRFEVDRQPQSTDRIEVIESRSYPPVSGLVGNGETVARALQAAGRELVLPLQSGAHASPASPIAQAAGQQTLHTLRIQLNPAALGHVTAVMKLSGGTLTVELQVETIEALRQLSDDNQAISKSLRAQGYSVEHITVQHVASDRSNSQAMQQSFANPQQAGADDGNARNTSGGTNGERRDNGGNNARRSGSDSDDVAQASTVAGRGSSDGVYL